MLRDALCAAEFARQLANRNVIFRIPTPVFGLGLVEATPDSTLQANLAANRRIKSQLGIGGISIPAATTARSLASAGRRRTSR